MKIAILTFIKTNNYGATLQGYSTTRFLQKMGHEVVLINVPLLNAGAERKSNIINKISQKIIDKMSSISSVNRSLKLEQIRTEVKDNDKQKAKYFDDLNMRHFDEFRNKYLPNITEEYYYDADFQNNFPHADLYIVGSDQVWNPWVTNDQVDIFFFSFLPNKSKRISYAPSFGGTQKWIYSNKETAYIKELLLKFDGVSVRDSNSLHVLNNVFKLPGIEVLDPTFLIDNYDELLNESDLDASGSLFVFKFIINEYWVDTIKHISSQLNLDVRMDSCLIPYEDLEFKPECTVVDWLKLIKTSDFVFTDSFHGMVFCILFRKEFIVTPSYKNGEGRYIDLAKKLGLEDRLFFDTKSVKNNTNVWLEKIDYDSVYNKIENLRSDSRQYLMSFLS